MELFRTIPKDNKGEKNPMFGKKHSKESIKKNRESQPYNSENFPQWLKDKIGEKSKGENNAMFGKSFYDIWLIKYGKDIADTKLNEYKQNLVGKIWIRNMSLYKCKQVKVDIMFTYLNAGWEIGRLKQKTRPPISDFTRLKQSKKRKEYWKSKKEKI